MKWKFWKAEDKTTAKIVFVLLFMLYGILTFFLFFYQAIEYQGIYMSDMKAYIQEVQGIESGYEFPYPFFFGISRIWSLLISPEAAVALTTALLNLGSVAILKYYFNREGKSLLGVAGKQWNVKWDILITGAVFALFFASMIYSPKGTSFLGFDYAYRCMGIFTPNPYWNATYLATRPFAILCFFQGVEVLRTYERAFSWKKNFVFGVALFLTTITKPSFTFIIVPLFGLVMVFRLCKSRLRNFKNTFYLGCYILPTGLALLYQFFGVFTGQNVLGEETGIGFEIGKAWHVYSQNIPLSIIMGLAFPLGILLLNWKKLKKDAIYRLAWQLLAVGMITFLCLYEKGFRFTHMNFSWGYMHGMFFVYAVSIIMMIRNTLEWKNKFHRLLLIPEWGAFALHLICGMNYFIYTMRGLDNAGF